MLSATVCSPFSKMANSNSDSNYSFYSASCLHLIFYDVQSVLELHMAVLPASRACSVDLVVSLLRATRSSS